MEVIHLKLLLTHDMVLLLNRSHRFTLPTNKDIFFLRDHNGKKNAYRRQ